MVPERTTGCRIVGAGVHSRRACAAKGESSMSESRRRRPVVILGSVLAASLAAGSIAVPVAAAPDTDAAEQRAEMKAERAKADKPDKTEEGNKKNGRS